MVTDEFFHRLIIIWALEVKVISCMAQMAVNFTTFLSAFPIR